MSEHFPYDGDGLEELKRELKKGHVTPRDGGVMPSRTRLTEKASSPMVIRKFTRFGFPVYVGIITDDDLDELDQHVNRVMEERHDLWRSDSIQDKRKLAGLLNDVLQEIYPRREGIAITIYVDKLFVSSLFGDFMNHSMCRYEYYTLLQIGTAV